VSFVLTDIIILFPPDKIMSIIDMLATHTK
jgi:hypothetical protein